MNSNSKAQRRSKKILTLEKAIKVLDFLASKEEPPRSERNC